MLKRADETNARERAAIAEEREAVDRDRSDWEATAHDSVLDEIERAFAAETVSNKSVEEKCPHHHFEVERNEILEKKMTPPPPIHTEIAH